MRWLALLGCLVLSTVWAPGALAAVSCSGPSTLPITLPSVTVSSNTPQGAPLGPPTQVTATFTCTGLPYDSSTFGQTVTFQAGDLAAIDTANDPPTGGGIMFSTSKSGVSLQLTATPVQASDNACLRCGPGSTRGWEAATITYPNSSVTVTLTAQLIKTGTTVSAGTVPKINQLLRFYWYIYGITASVGPITTVSVNSTSITSAACSLNIGNQNVLAVTLPTISTNALRGTGSVAGTTPFNLTYQCSTGAKLSMSMSSSTTWSSTLGVLSSSAACPSSSQTPAKNVGVQVLQSDYTPMSFSQAQSLGNSPDGTLTIPYYAQYYQTATPVSAGPVCATATFTMSYK
ncbi:fimbrial protein [Dyella silvae]|uniref:fimbrial protein n=1 Tax=Dyella silvae TaxID=2994424 RepID=UPI002265229C|nr:fimbrial protein [Dyella silvae]